VRVSDMGVGNSEFDVLMSYRGRKNGNIDRYL